MFTVSDSFNGITDFVQNLTAQNIKFVPIVEAGIASRPGQNYTIYNQLMASQAYIKNPDGSPTIG